MCHDKRPHWVKKKVTPGGIDGQIKEIAFGTSCPVFEQEGQKAITSLLKSLSSSLDSRVKYVFSAPEGAQETLENILEEVEIDHYEIAFYPNRCKQWKNRNFTQWLRDIMITHVTEAGNRQFLQSKTSPHFESEQILSLKSIVNAEIIGLSFFFEGGNILIGDDFLLAGEDLLLKDSGPNHDRRFLELLLQAFYGSHREIIWVGRAPRVRTFQARSQSRQPIFHIDMFISLAGRVLRGPDKGKYLLYVADPRTFSGPLPSYAEAFDFDLITNHLRRSNRFVVLRNPIIYINENDAQLLNKELFQLEMPFIRDQPIWLSSNNALVEINSGYRAVHLPHYTLSDEQIPHGISQKTSDLLKFFALQDLENIQIWKLAGFEVNPIGPMNYWATQSGSLRCLTWELRREL